MRIVPLVFAAVTLGGTAVTGPAKYLPKPTVNTRSITSTVIVREVLPANATSTTTFGNIFMVRETSGGRVIVNDGLRRQLTLLDAQLSKATVVLDSINEGGPSYGPIASPLLRYLGDSSLALDSPSRTFFVLDGGGKIVRTMAAPKQTDLGRMWAESSGIDQHGNLLYRAFVRMIYDTATLANGVTTRKGQQPDSVAIVRGLFQTRTVDTIARVKLDNMSRTLHTTYEGGRKTLYLWLNPLSPIDEWAALSDGTVALVRGGDYHVDFLRPDGSRKSSGKLPYDWKALSDSDKQHLIDSTRAVIEQVRADAAQTGGVVEGNNAVVRYLRASVTPTLRPVAPPATNAPTVIEATVSYEFVPLKNIADYYPPIRYGGASADEQGNLWLLPTTSAQSKQGELVYDVVNPRDTNFYRVRMPVGRSIAGFGKKGVIYLRYRSGTEWRLERTRVESTVSAKH